MVDDDDDNGNSGGGGGGGLGNDCNNGGGKGDGRNTLDCGSTRGTGGGGGGKVTIDDNADDDVETVVVLLVLVSVVLLIGKHSLYKRSSSESNDGNDRLSKSSSKDSSFNMISNSKTRYNEYDIIYNMISLNMIPSSSSGGGVDKISSSLPFGTDNIDKK